MNGAAGKFKMALKADGLRAEMRWLIEHGLTLDRRI
jgi:hypothetical protein